MTTWRIWQKNDNGVTETMFITANHPSVYQDWFLYGFTLMYSFEALTYNEAHKKRNELLGWEPYVPSKDFPEGDLPFEDG